MFEGLMSVSEVSASLDASPGAGMRTSMDDLPAVQVGQAIQHALGNFSENLFSSPSSELLDFLVDTVQASTLAELHGNGNRARRLIHKSSVVATNVF